MYIYIHIYVHIYAHIYVHIYTHIYVNVQEERKSMGCIGPWVLEHVTLRNDRISYTNRLSR